MKINSFGYQFAGRLRKATALVSLIALVGTTFAAVAGQSMKATSTAKGSKLSEEQRILHVLNRLGFGARPGDVERVKAMGVEKYIELQLNPDKIDDSASEARLENLDALRLTTAQLYEKYPQPGQLLQQLQRRNQLPADLAAARDNRVKGGANAAPNQNQPKSGDATSGEMQGPPANTANANPNPNPNPNPNANANDANPMNNPEYRRAVYE